MGSRLGAVGLAALVTLAVLGFDPAGWYWFGPTKWLVVSALVPAGAAIVLVTRPARIVVRPTVAAIALVGVVGLAASFALDPRYAWTGTPERHFGVVTWLCCLVALVAGMALTRDRDRSIVLGGVALASLGLGVVATAEALGWEPDLLDVDDRLSATLGSPAYLGAAVALLLPACAGCASDRRLPRPLRVVSTAAIVPLLVAMVGSGGRAAWVGLAVSTVVALVARREQLLRHRRRAVLVTGGLVAALVLVALVSPAGGRVTATFDDDEPGGRGRLDEWRVAARVVASHPLLGVGPEGYRIAFAEEVDASYERDHGRDPLPDRAHAAPLDVALSGGVLAVGAWLAFLALASVHVWRALRSGEAWLAGLAAGLIAYTVGGFLLFPLAELEPIVWLLGGVLMAATARPREARELVVPRSVIAVLAVGALVAAPAGVLDVIADRHARDAVDALAEGRAADALRHAKDAASTRPDEVRLHLLSARAAIADEQGFAAGLDQVENALDVSPDDPIARLEHATLLVDRARATLLPHHATEARAEVAALVERDPNNAALRMLEGAAALADGDPEAAAAAWHRAADLAPDDPAPLTALAALDRDRAAGG